MACLGTLAAAGALPNKSLGATLPQSLSAWLVGTWTLESFTSTDDKGVETDAMGAGATGYLSYSADGWMSVQLMRADRKPFQVPDMDGGTVEQTVDAARSYFAYAGPYAVDEAACVVYHNLLFSLMPNWVGGKQKRYVRKLGNGELELSGDPALIAGKMQTNRLRWRRRAANE
jgi:hypothetical protein